ncbi:MAG: glycosyltransferase [Planctomycetes bacterium]|nr:glycosyltransferase [Planctomycetota bacterium]
MMRAAPDLSVVVPLYDEYDNVQPLLSALRRALDPVPWTYELVLVDDGSTDGTRQLLTDAARRDPRIRVVLLSRNFGQTAAMAAGFDVCRGRRVVTMDGDLQNDPSDIPRLVDALEDGFDVVCGWRRDRQDRAFSRKLPSRIANRLISMFTGVRIHDTGCTLKAYRSWVVRKLHLYSDMHRFIPALAAGVGGRVREMPVKHHARRYGTSKYGIGRIFRVLTDLLVVRLLVRFASHPVRYFGLISFPLFFVSFGFILLGLLKFGDGKGVRFLVSWDISYITCGVLTLVTALNLFLLGLLCELSVHVSGFFQHAGRELVDTGDHS